MHISSKLVSTRLAFAIAGLLGASSVGAANAAFQDLLFAACDGATGALAARCAETLNGEGNVSTDSESSLNPSQALGHGRAQVDGVSGGRDDWSDEAARLEVGPFGLRFSVYGERFERDRGDSAVEERGMDGDSRGGDIGLDYRLSDTVTLGAVLGTSQSDYDFDTENPSNNFTPQSNAGSADIDQTQLTLFASFALGNDAYVDLSGGHAWTEGDFRRRSVFQESTRTVAQTNTDLRGSADGSVRWLGIDAGRDFVREAWSFGVFGGATWARAEIDGYTETDVSGSGLAMRFSEVERDSFLGVAGGRVAYTISSGSGVFIPQLRVQWQHEFEDDQETVDASFVLDGNGNFFTLQGDRPDTSSGEAGFSITAVFPEGWSAYFDYTTLFSRDDFERDRFSAGLRKEF